jgi:hypothetical protein
MKSIRTVRPHTPQIFIFVIVLQSAWVVVEFNGLN